MRVQKINELETKCRQLEQSLRAFAQEHHDLEIKRNKDEAIHTDESLIDVEDSDDELFYDTENGLSETCDNQSCIPSDDDTNNNVPDEKLNGFRLVTMFEY